MANELNIDLTPARTGYAMTVQLLLNGVLFGSPIAATEPSLGYYTATMSAPAGGYAVRFIVDGTTTRATTPKTVVTDWEELVAEIMSDSEFKAAWIAASSIDPTIAWSLSTAFSMVGQGYPGNFNNIFNTMCELAQVTSEQREVWADIGATFNAPSEFLDIVRGVINGE